MPCCDTNQHGDDAQAVLPHVTLKAGVENAVFLIQKMDCPTEEKLIRDHFTGMAGIDGMQFNLMARELTVQHRLPSTEPIVLGCPARHPDQGRRVPRTRLRWGRPEPIRRCKRPTSR